MQKKSLGRIAALSLMLLAFLALPVDARETRYLTGNAADVSPKLNGPAFDFGGGGSDIKEAFQSLINEIRGCASCATKLDVVVLRSSGADGYNSFFYALDGVDSVETLVITNREDSNDEGVVKTIKNAEIIFFAGGDQCNYVRYFKGTKIEDAIKHVYSKGGGIGGTSAGYAIQTEFVYDGCEGSTRSNEALSDPYHKSISFTYDFLTWPHFENSFADTHFVARDRMGRLMAFIARQIQEKKASRVLGIGINEKTSLVINKNGIARVMGEGPVYLVLGDHKPEVCKPGVALTFTRFKIWRALKNETVNLRNMPSSGYYLISVDNGKLSADPY